MPRGSRQDKRGRLKWRNKSASCGRRGGQGSKPRFTSYKDVLRSIRRNRTKIVVPSQEDRDAAKAASEPKFSGAKVVPAEVPRTAELMNVGGDGLSGLGARNAITPQYYILGVKPERA